MVKIKCINPTSLGIFNYYVKIYDESGNLISEGYTQNNVYLFNNECNNGLYRLEVINKCISPYFISLCFIPIDCLYVYFTTSTTTTNSSTFYLTDKNYIGLPIERGELYLWQAHTV